MPTNFLSLTTGKILRRFLNSKFAASVRLVSSSTVKTSLVINSFTGK
ncbi:hypothetical protein ES705_14722 [subsurface metagenome]